MLVSVGVKLAITGMRTSLMMPVRCAHAHARLALRAVGERRDLLDANVLDARRVHARLQRELRRRAGFLAHAATFASLSLPRFMISLLCSARYERISLTKS